MSNLSVPVTEVRIRQSTSNYRLSLLGGADASMCRVAEV